MSIDYRSKLADRIVSLYNHAMGLTDDDHEHEYEEGSYVYCYTGLPEPLRNRFDLVSDYC